MIKRTPNGIYVSDELTVDMSKVKPELKDNFIKKVRDFEQAGRIGVAPKLVATVAATHAGLPTGNMAFYTPDRMKSGLPSFTNDFAKPVLLHHNDAKDPVGRVYRATYKDLSHLYVEPMQQFKERYGGNIFTDTKVDLDKAFDQVDWVIENMMPMSDYVGLGYGELDLHISDADAAEKIMDQRYLTVSVGFTTDSMYCSNCHQDWASEGFCEHERGKVYDDKKTLVIPGSFHYEEVSWINSPADTHAKVLSVSETPSLISQPGLPELNSVTNRQDSMCLPILISVSDGIVSRLDSFKRVTPERAQEVINVSKQKDNTQPKAPELIKTTINDEEFEFVADAAELLKVEDAKRENYVTDEVNGHKHRVIIDPATGNGYMSYDASHTHNVINRTIEESGDYEWNEDSGKSILKNAHSHELGEKIPPLTDNIEETTETPEGEVEDTVVEDNVETEEVSDPTVFELTDYASVVAARAAVEASELTDAQKARTLISINKKAEELEIKDELDEFEVIEVELVDPENEDSKITLAFTSEESFKESLAAMTPEAIAANKDQLEKACSVFGTNLPTFEDDATGASGTPLTKREAQLAAMALFNNIDSAFIDKFIEGLNNIGSDEGRKELANYLIDKLIAEALIDNIFADYNALQKELQDTREKLAAVTKSNRDFYAGKQDDLARVVVALKVALKKPEFIDLNEEALGDKAKELKVRSVDSLQDSLNDLINEFSDTQIETDTKEVIETPVEPDLGTIIDKQENNRQNMEIFRDMSDSDYAFASRLQNRFKNRS